MACPEDMHVHCNYCKESFLMNDAEYERLTYHLRDSHPEVWREDFQLQAWAYTRYGIPIV